MHYNIIMDLPSETKEFNLENKIREGISELLSSVMLKCDKHEKVLAKLRRRDKEKSEKLISLEENLNKNVIRMIPLDMFNQKAMEIRTEAKSLESLVTSKLDHYKSEMNTANRKLDYFKSMLKAQEDLQRSNQETFKLVENSSRELKENITLQMSNLSNVINKTSYQSFSLMENMDNKIEKMVHKLKDLNEKAVYNLQFFLKQSTEHNAKIDSKLESVIKERVDKRQILDMRRRFDEELTLVKSKFNLDIRSINTYLDNAFKFEINRKIFNAVLPVFEFKQLKNAIPRLEKLLKKADSVIENPKDKLSQQLPASTLSQITYHRKYFENQIKFCKDKVKEMEVYYMKSIETRMLEKIAPIQAKSQTINIAHTNADNFIAHRAISDISVENQKSMTQSLVQARERGNIESPNSKRELLQDKNLYQKEERKKKAQYESPHEKKISFLQDTRRTREIPKEKSQNRIKHSPSKEHPRSPMLIPTKNSESLMSSSEKPYAEVHSSQNYSENLRDSTENKTFNKEDLDLNSSILLNSAKSGTISQKDSRSTLNNIRNSAESEKSSQENPKHTRNNIRIPEEGFPVIREDLHQSRGHSTNSLDQGSIGNSFQNVRDSNKSSTPNNLQDHNPPKDDDLGSNPSLPEDYDQKLSENYIEDSENDHSQDFPPSDEELENNESSPFPPITSNPKISPEVRKSKEPKRLRKVRNTSKPPISERIPPSESSSKVPPAAPQHLTESQQSALDSFTDAFMEKSKEINKKLSDFVNNQIEKLIISRDESISTIENSTLHLRNQLVNEQEELRLHIKLIHEENKQILKQRVHELARTESEFKYIKSILESCDTEIHYIKQELSNINSSSEIVLRTQQMIYCLLRQDEEDREGIQLTGMYESKPKVSSKSKNSVNLKTECMSCSGHDPSIYSAFKMACLNYAPSEVTFNGKVYPRKQLIEMLGENESDIVGTPLGSRVLEKLSKSTICHNDSFLKDKSKTPKISGRFLLNNTMSKIESNNGSPKPRKLR